MTAGGFRVDPEDLVVRAGSVADSAARLDRAAVSGGTVRWGPDAYGTLCSFLPMMLGSYQSSVTRVLRHCADSLNSVAKVLEQNADAYLAGESGAGDAITAVGELLDDGRGSPGGSGSPAEPPDVRAQGPDEGTGRRRTGENP